MRMQKAEKGTVEKGTVEKGTAEKETVEEDMGDDDVGEGPPFYRSDHQVSSDVSRSGWSSSSV